jgi:PAS domain S-box-containing protein
MKIAPLPFDEHKRLEELRKYSILDTEPESVFEDMVNLANFICKTPIAAISLVDERRQWFKAITGVDAKETSRDVAFCAHTILRDETMIVPDALLDERFHDNPLVTGETNIRFYAGVPLATPTGRHLGTLCVIDHEPRELTAEQFKALKTLTDSVMAHLNLRLSHQNIRQQMNELQIAAAIFESANEAMVVTDHNNKIITINPAFTVITGYTLEEVVGQSPHLLKSGVQDEMFYQKMWEVLNISGCWNGELWNRHKNGELYYEWLSIKTLFNEDGSKRIHIAIFTDITKRKRAEELLEKFIYF